MKYQVLFSLKNNEKIFMNVVCCSRDWPLKGSIHVWVHRVLNLGYCHWFHCISNWEICTFTFFYKILKWVILQKQTIHSGGYWKSRVIGLGWNTLEPRYKPIRNWLHGRKTGKLKACTFQAVFKELTRTSRCSDECSHSEKNIKLLSKHKHCWTSVHVTKNGKDDLYDGNQNI